MTTGTKESEREAVPVRFDTYVAKVAATKGASIDVATIPETKAPATKADDSPLSNIADIGTLHSVGFGVFGYYDDNKEYDSKEDRPNFMYNQKVTWNESGLWNYAPLKYWPNESGTDESEGRADRLTFFSYAPYLTDDSRLTFSGKDQTGDPTATYITPSDLGQCLDVLYATDADGKPLTNLTKQNVGGSVMFHFHHTMSRLNFNVRAAFDEVTAGDKTKADNTRITVESITLETENSEGSATPLFFTSGTLNLNTGIWSNAANSSQTGTPKIVLSGEALGTDVRDQGDKKVSEMLDGGNNIIPGVDNTWRNAGKGYLTLLPNAGLSAAEAPKLKVTIVYYTTSDDPRLVLSGGRTRVKNTVSNTLSGFIFERGKAYAINMLIGMTSVKFTMDVQLWRDPITFAPIVEAWGSNGDIINFDKVDE